MSLPVEQVLQRVAGPVAVLLGGRSAEREISLQSGRAVADALKEAGFAVVTVDTGEPTWMQQMRGCAIAFIALHGPGGEDGVMQGALEVLGIPYTGSGVLASALAMDKLRCKQLWRGMGLPTPDFAVLRADSNWMEISDALGAAIVKPACEGSSIGMSRAAGAAQLQSAYETAASYGEVFAEQWVEGEEYTVAILGREALPVIRLETDNAFYDYEAKYLSNATRYICPCGLSAGDERAMQELALKAFESLGCSGWGRVDIMRDREGAMQLLEVNTVPGMTDHSLVPMAAQAAGYDFKGLVTAIVEQCVGDKA